MNINRYTPELHAKFRALLTPDILDGTITINYGGTNEFDVYTNLPIHRPIKQNKPELNITGLIAAAPALLDEIERLTEALKTAKAEGFETGKKEAITSLVYIIEGIQQDGETDQNIAHVPGETGRQKAKETWEEFLENPALYISEKLAPSIIGATYTTVIEESEAHIQDKQAEAWEQAIDTAYAHYLTEEQRDHLHTLNPYKETN